MLPANETTLIITGINMEWRKIHVGSDCNYLEIILLHSGSGDFMSISKVNRIRKREFKKLPKLHQLAFEKGIFKTEKPCFTDEFMLLKY